MAKKNKRLFTYLGVTVGTALAVYGLREGMRWYQRQQMNQESDMEFQDTTWPAERRYQPVHQPDREPIPATGPLTEAPPMAVTDMPTAREYTSSQQAAGIPPAADVQQAAEMEQAADIVLDEYVAPLIEHAIAFHSVINLLNSRQREGEGFEATESLTSGDRNSMRAVLDQMKEHMPDQDEGSLKGNPLAQRSYKLTRKMRDALDNLDYTGSDLFRIHGEIKSEICTLGRELGASGKVTITGLDHISQLYECQ